MTIRTRVVTVSALAICAVQAVAVQATTLVTSVEEGEFDAIIHRQEMDWGGKLPFPMHKVTVQVQDAAPGARDFAERMACADTVTMGAEPPTRYGSTWTFVFLRGDYD